MSENQYQFQQSSTDFSLEYETESQKYICQDSCLSKINCFLTIDNDLYSLFQTSSHGSQSSLENLVFEHMAKQETNLHEFSQGESFEYQMPQSQSQQEPDNSINEEFIVLNSQNQDCQVEQTQLDNSLNEESIVLNSQNQDSQVEQTFSQQSQSGAQNLKAQKYPQNQAYKGMFQRFCSLFNLNPPNKSKSYLTYFVQKLAEVKNNINSSNNKMVKELVGYYNKNEGSDFIEHLVEKLKLCKNGDVSKHPEGKRAAQNVYKKLRKHLGH